MIRSFNNTGINKTGKVPETGQRHRGFLFTAGAIAVIAGLLVPLSARMLDVILIFSISLTAAVLIITFSARGISEVLGFPLLIVLATMLRMALSVACSHLILSQGNAGAIIGLFGRLTVGNNCVLAILVFGVLVMVVFRTICRAVSDISRAASDFTTEIVPVRQISVDGDLNAGVINKSQALKLRGKIARETGFFAAMVGAARFILCAAVIELLIIVVNIVAPMAMGAVGGTATGISVRTYATLAVGAGMVTQISALLAAVASRYLVRKGSASLAANDKLAEQEAAGRIEVVANEVTPPKAAGLQYCNTAALIKSGAAGPRYIESGSAEITKPAANANIEAEKIVSEDLEWFDGQATDDNEEGNLSLWVWEVIKDSDSFGAVAELIGSKSSDAAKTILMAAENVKELPVTIPVNIAMRLAQKGQRCLLIDLDLERDAISKVFDIDSDRAQGEVVATCVSNLWVWSGSYFTEVISSLESQYDHLVVYAPNMKLSADGEQIAGCVQAAMLFGPEGKFKSSSLDDFHKLLMSYGCEILEPAEVLAGAV